MFFRTILRYYLAPGYAEEERLRELTALCREARVEEVMLFYNPEELYQGYPPPETVEQWFALARKAAQALRSAGVAMSLNPWTTLGHLAYGRKTTRPYRRMVGENGVEELMVACPLDPQWLVDLSALFARMARELSPAAIWLEDDLRLHNHNEALGYGGCYCPLHLERFARLAGRPSVSRRELLARILEPGEPHPWRALWLHLCRESLLEPARRLAEAVRDANPAVRLGLMCSLPDAHSTEGRDWDALKQALSPHGPLLVRPHQPPYTEVTALQVTPAVTRQTISEFSGPTEAYPELENSPRCGAYSKSAAYCLFEATHAALFGARGMAVNHYDMMGTGLSLDPRFPRRWREGRPFLDAIASLGLDDRQTEGITVLHSPQVAAAMHTPAGAATLAVLQNDSITWGDAFTKLGIAHRFATSPPEAGVVAVSGQTLRAFSDAEVSALLAGSLLLDAPSAEILLERGFGTAIGIADARWIAQADTGFAYEEIPRGRREGYGLDAPRMTASRCADAILACTPLPGVEPCAPMRDPSCSAHSGVRTVIRRYDHVPCCPGLLVYRNSLGGAVATIAYPMTQAQFNMGFFNAYRRILLQSILLELSGGKGMLFGLDEPLQAYRLRLPDGHLLALLNPTHDTYSQVRFQAGGLDLAQAQRLDYYGGWTAAGLLPEGGGRWRSPAPLPPLRALVLRLK